MDRTPPKNLPPLSLRESIGNPNSPPPLPMSPPVREWMFDTSEGTISAPTATHTVTIPTYSWEKTDTQETVVPETPELELASLMESQSSVLPETPDLEAISEGFEADVPETPVAKRQRKRRISEEEWFKEFLVMLLPGMADLL